MTESESPRRIRITKSMLGRLGAVGLFLSLGTLAVMHTVKARNSADPQANAGATGDAAATAESDSASHAPDSPNSESPSNDNDSAGLALQGTVPASTAVGDISGKKPLPSILSNHSAPPTAPSLSGVNGFPSGSSKPASAPAMLAGMSRPGEPNGTPATNASSTMQPPPTMSFSDDKSSSPSSQKSNSIQDPPIASAQIQIETDDEGSGESPSQGTPISPPPTRSFTMPGETKSPGAGFNTLQASPTDNSDRLSTSQSRSAAVPPLSSSSSSIARPSATSTPYDPASEPSMPPIRSPSGGSADSSPTSNTSSAIGIPALAKSPAGTSTNNAFGSSKPFDLGKPPAESPITRSALSNSNASASPVGTRSVVPGGSSPVANSGFGSTPSDGSDAVRVQATPGATNLEGPQIPSLKLQKVAPREVQINKPAEFQLIVQNAGQVTAEQVVVHDRVPQGTELIETSPKASLNADGTLSWNLGTIAPGETVKITINLMPKTPGEFGSVAQVTFAAQASARTLCTQPILEVSLNTKPKVLIGDEVVLDILLENKGDGPATNVLLQEDVPDLLAFEDGNRELEFEIGTLAPGQKRNVQLRLKAVKVGMTQNRIVAQGDAGLETSDSAALEIVAPELQVSGEGPTRKYLNRQATHQFAVANAGTATANNVDLVARLPRGLKFVSANNHGQFDPSSNSVYWSLQQLATGQVGKVDLVTMPVEPGDQLIAFEATADLNQKASLNKTLTVDYLVELFCEIDDLADPIEIDGETAYRIKVVNQGLQAATNIRLNVDFPSGIEPSSVSGTIPHQIQGQRVVFSPIDRLDPKQESVVTITARGTIEGDHRVVVSMSSDARETQVAKEETTRVYSDQK